MSGGLREGEKDRGPRTVIVSKGKSNSETWSCQGEGAGRSRERLREVEFLAWEAICNCDRGHDRPIHRCYRSPEGEYEG